MSSRSHLILGIGNPLLDISADTPQELLDKYGLRVNNAILAEESHLPLYPEMESTFQCDYIAGGATQNTVRAAQWWGKQPGATAYMGCVGSDAYAEKLRGALSSGGSAEYYAVTSEFPTGTCACLIHGKERSLVANLGAASHYTLEHARANWDVVENAEIIYSSGFFYTTSGETGVECSKSTGARGKIYAINLGAEFIIEVCKSTIEAVMPNTDYVFCNESEITKYGAVNGLEGFDIPRIANHIAQLPKEGSRPRKVVVTRGHESTIVADNEGIMEYPVPAIPAQEIIDTNGAGDSFVGAFLMELARGSDIARCIGAGHWLAGEVIKRSGCVFPDTEQREFEIPQGTRLAI